MYRMFGLVVLASFAPIASGDPPRYVRKQELHLDVHVSDRVRPIAPRTAPPAEPVVEADDILRVEQLAAPLRRQQENILLGLIRDTPDTDPDKPDYMFRLAEQYAKQQRWWRLKSVELTITTP